MAAKFSAAKHTGRTEAGPEFFARSLTFEAPYLIEKLVKDRVCSRTRTEAQALFREVKRYFYLNRMRPERGSGRCTRFASTRSGISSCCSRGEYMDFCAQPLWHIPAAQSEQRPGAAEAGPGRTVPVASIRGFPGVLREDVRLSLYRTAGTTTATCALHRPGDGRADRAAADPAAGRRTGPSW